VFAALGLALALFSSSARCSSEKKKKKKLRLALTDMINIVNESFSLLIDASADWWHTTNLLVILASDFTSIMK
jgi:hypothetical protein